MPILCSSLISAVSFYRLLTFFLVASITGCTQDKPTVYQWRLQSHATANSIDYKELKAMTENIAVMSSGRLLIETYPGGEIVSGPNIFNAVSERQVEMGNGWPNWWSGQHPAWAVMNAGPFDFMNIDASMMFFLAGEGTMLANELSHPKDVLWRPAWWPGMEFGLLSTKPIKSIDDLKEMKIRIGPGLPSEVLTEVSGAYAIPLVPKEIKPALIAGDLDAVEWTTTSGAWNLGLQDIAKNAIVPAIWQPSVLSDILINRSAYNELPVDLKQILETAIKAFTLTTTLKSKVEDFTALNDFVNSGTQIYQWPKEDLKQWKQASDKILQSYSEKDDFSGRLIEAKRDFKTRYNKYYELFGPYDQGSTESAVTR